MIEIDRFADIETSEWTNFAVGGVITAGTEEYFYTTDEDELFWHLLAPHKGTTWLWNGGKFDTLWILDKIQQHYATSKIDLTCKIGTAGTRITSLECAGVTFRDSVALIPMSLKKGALIAGIEMSKDTGLACNCECACEAYQNAWTTPRDDTGNALPCKKHNCGGYCRIQPELRGLTHEEREAFLAYMKADIVTGLRIMERVIQEAEDCDYDLTGTIGGSSFKTAKRRLNIAPAKWKSSRYKLARMAYFGGRTEVFQPSAEKGYAYDINSAYPAALSTTPLPTGEMLECSRDKAKRAWDRGKEGLYMARCIVPPMFIPPLPVRLNSGRVCFPIGPISGIWPAIELREAIRLGCDVEITGGLVWSDSEIVFKDFMQDIFANRAQYNPDGPTPNAGLRQWHKWFANSLTGKLAEKPEKERIVMYPDRDKIVWCPGGKCKASCSGDNPASACGTSKCCERKHRGTCGAWRMLDTGGSLYLAPFFRISECAHVHWAAYLTASARIVLARQLRADGQGGQSALYCDTDSVYATQTRSEDIGPKLGQWGYDGIVRDWLAIAPKLYRYEDDEGRQVVKAKGLSGITRAGFDAFVKGETFESRRGVKSFKSACKDKSGSLFVRKHLIRTNHADGLHYGSRLLKEDGKTYPQTMTALLAWELETKTRKLI